MIVLMGLECAEEKHEFVYTLILSGNNQNIQFTFGVPISSSTLVSRRYSDYAHGGNRAENIS